MLAYNHEEITARKLKPALRELDGISRETIEAHYRLYEGYVAKRNEILSRLAEVDLAGANQVYSELRSLKVDLTFALGGIKNHELYFDHLGGSGGDPKGGFGRLVPPNPQALADALTGVLGGRREAGAVESARSRFGRGRQTEATLDVYKSISLCRTFGTPVRDYAPGSESYR